MTVVKLPWKIVKQKYPQLIGTKWDPDHKSDEFKDDETVQAMLAEAAALNHSHGDSSSSSPPPSGQPPPAPPIAGGPPPPAPPPPPPPTQAKAPEIKTTKGTKKANDGKGGFDPSAVLQKGATIKATATDKEVKNDTKRVDRFISDWMEDKMKKFVAQKLSSVQGSGWTWAKRTENAVARLTKKQEDAQKAVKEETNATKKAALTKKARAYEALINRVRVETMEHNDLEKAASNFAKFAKAFNEDKDAGWKGEKKANDWTWAQRKADEAKKWQALADEMSEKAKAEEDDLERAILAYKAMQYKKMAGTLRTLK